MRGWMREGVSHSVGRVWAMVAASALGLFGLVPSARSGWTIEGTTLQPDGYTAVPDVRVTVYPESLTSATDANGDFLIAWNGSRGWLTFVPPHPGPDNKEWCKRFVLFPRVSTAAESLLDIGVIRINTASPLLDPLKPVPPQGKEQLPTLRVPGPKPGEPDKYWQLMRFYTDPWGNTTSITEVQGDPIPPQVRDAVRKWIQKMPWVVQREIRCGEPAPFWNTLPFSYAWQDSVWVPVQNWGPPRRPGMAPGPASGGPPPSRPK